MYIRRICEDVLRAHQIFNKWIILALSWDSVNELLIDLIIKHVNIHVKIISTCKMK